MTSEQLQAARAQKWRQKANPLLTAEEAESWIESTGVSLFLPRKTQLQSPAPSFVEAVLGETSPTPPPAAIQNAFELATRLFTEEKATPLNLLGTVSEQPDFLVSPEALPYIFALRGDRDWKRGPRDKSSTLAVDAWKLLKREGALTTPELREQLGREVTEAAVLRALSELWSALRVLPVYTSGEATTWELFESRHQKAMQMGGGMAQATALSALISLYLDSSIAASSDEIEIFLSPLSPRSRIREVVRGLEATRQLLSIPLGTEKLLYIAGALADLPEIATPAEAPADSVVQQEETSSARERKSYPRRDKGDAEKPRFERGRKPFTPRETEDRPRRERPAFGERARGDRPAFGSRPAARGDRRPSSGYSQRGSDRPQKEWKPREDQEFRPRQAQDRGGFSKPFRSRTTGSDSGEKPQRREWKPRREEGQEGRKEFRPRRTGGEEFRPRRTEGGQFRPRRAEGGEFRPRRVEGGEFQPRRAEGGTGNRPYRSDNRRTGPRDNQRTEQRSGERPYRKSPPRDRDQERAPRREWKPRREEGERREFRPRSSDESGERRSFKPRSAEDRNFRPHREEGGFKGKPKPSGEKRFGAKRSFEGREGFDRKKPPQRERRVSGDDTERPRKSFSKPGFKSGKSFGAPKKSFGAPKKRSGGKSGFGAKRPSRPGGSRPSFGKRPNNRKGKKSEE